MKRSIRKIILMLVVGCLILSAAACSNTGTSSDSSSADNGANTEAESTELPRIAYIARTLSDPFAAWMASEAEKQAAADYSDVFTVDVYDSQGDIDKQNSLIEDCITKKYDLVIIQPNDPESQKYYVQKLVDAGIKCISTDGKIEVEGTSNIGADPYEQGAVLAEKAAELCPENGVAVLMNMLPGNIIPMTRFEAFHDIFVDKRTDVNVAAEITLEEVSEADAMATMEDWVQSYGKIDCCLTVADVAAMACREAVKDDPTFDNMLTFGVDGLAAALLAIKQDKYTGTILQDASNYAQLELKAADELLSGAEEQVEYNIDVIYIDKSNVDDYIALYLEYGLLTEEEVAAIE